MTQSTTKTVYTAKVHTVGGRDKGEARSSDGAGARDGAAAECHGGVNQGY